MNYAIYDSSGEAEAMPIVQLVSGVDADGQADADALGLAYVQIAPAVRDDTHYIKRSTAEADLRKLTPCTPSTTTLPADGTTALTLSNMGLNTHIQVRGPVDGELTASDTDTLTFTAPGRYTLTVTAPFPARPKELVIDAT